MSEVYEVEKVLGIKLNGAVFKGNDVCPCCRTKMKRCLEDLPLEFDWEHGRHEKFRVSGFKICNQCLYHSALLSIVGFCEEASSEILVRAYQVCMNLETTFFNPIGLSCETIAFADTFALLERRDEEQSMYCQIFNNAYDLLLTGGAKSYFQTKNWPEVLTYKRGRFYKMFTMEEK